MDEHDPSKRIPKSLGTETKLLGTYTMTDIAVGLVPAVVIVLLTQVLLPDSLYLFDQPVQSLTLPLALVMVGLGGIFVYLTPDYTTSLEWIATLIGFHTQSRELGHEAAKEYTQIERIYPDEGAIERTDGAMLGLIEVTPPTMALATDKEWATKAESFQDFLNTTVEFPIQIFSTTQGFPVDEYLTHYESRLDDPDVKTNPRLEALIEHYVEWYRQDLADRRMTIRDHYVVVPVTPAEVQFDQGSLIEQLADLPVLGMFIQTVCAPPRAEERAALFDALDDRLTRVETGLREIDGCSAHRVPATDAVQIIGDFWAGHDREYGNIEQTLRRTPYVGVGGRS